MEICKLQKGFIQVCPSFMEKALKDPLLSLSYEPTFCLFYFWKRNYDISMLWSVHPESAKTPGVKSAKLTDIKASFKFMDQERTDCMEAVLKESAYLVQNNMV